MATMILSVHLRQNGRYAVYRTDADGRERVSTPFKAVEAAERSLQLEAERLGLPTYYGPDGTLRAKGG